MAVTEYFRLSWLDEGWVPVAQGRDDEQQDLVLAQVAKIRRWKPLRLTVESNELVDYLPNNLGVRLCSLRMRQVIDSNLGSKDLVQWLLAEVVDTFGSTHDYFVLHLPGSAEILDPPKSIKMRKFFAVKSVTDVGKAERRNLFRPPGARKMLFVSNELREILIKEGCTGLSFELLRQPD